MHCFKQAQGAGYAHRLASDQRFGEGHRAAVGLQEPFRHRASRRSLAPVDRVQFPGRRVPIEKEGAAADARGLRLHQIQDELHRNRRVRRRPAALQHIVASADRVRVRRRDHETVAGD